MKTCFNERMLIENMAREEASQVAYFDKLIWIEKLDNRKLVFKKTCKFYHREMLHTLRFN